MSEKAQNSPKQQGAAALPPDIAKLSFEEALGELEKLVRQLEDGKAKLDDAISAYERGALLKRHCEAKLRDAQQKIEQIAIGSDGKVSLAPFNS
jgi:exodeoxyribonuclease VII small subunit